MGTRRIRREQRQADMAESRRRNGRRKSKERSRRYQRMIEIIRSGPFPYTPAVMSWLSQYLDKPATQITTEDVAELVAEGEMPGGEVIVLAGGTITTPTPDEWNEVHVLTDQAGVSQEANVDLVAAGGPCPIVVLYNPAQNAGALVHIEGGHAELNDDEHESLLDTIRDTRPMVFQPGAQAVVCLDELPLAEIPGLLAMMPPEDQEEQKVQRLAYGERIRAYLASCGVVVAPLVTTGLGKTAILNTAKRSFTVTDEQETEVTGGTWKLT